MTRAAIPTNRMIAGVILAGGRSTRMGGRDKFLCRLGDRSLLAHVVVRAKPQVGVLLINGSANRSELGEFSCPVISDAVADFAGPLAGILAAIEYARNHCPEVRWIASFATDTPWFPDDLVERLFFAAQQDAVQIAVAASGERSHPVFALWTLDIEDSLRAALLGAGPRKVQAFQRLCTMTTVSWPVSSHDPFFNINTPQDLASAELKLQQLHCP